MVFAGYSGFLHYLQLASHELALIGINVTKNKIRSPKPREVLYSISWFTMVKVLIRMKFDKCNIPKVSGAQTLNIWHKYKWCSGNSLSCEWVKVQRSSSALRPISKILWLIYVSSGLLFNCFINDNNCKRCSGIQLRNIKESYPPFHFRLVGSLISCTLS